MTTAAPEKTAEKPRSSWINLAVDFGPLLVFFLVYRRYSPAEDGDGAYRCMQAALGRAGITAADLDYINAHGTSTPVGDEIELRAVERLLANAPKRPSMSSTKSATGHLLGAAGAIEAIFTVLAIRDQVAPPTINLDNPSVETDIDLEPQAAFLSLRRDVAQHGFLAQPVQEPVRPIQRFVHVGRDERVLILRAADAGADLDVLNRLEEDRHAGDRCDGGLEPFGDLLPARNLTEVIKRHLVLRLDPRLGFGGIVVFQPAKRILHLCSVIVIRIVAMAGDRIGKIGSVCGHSNQGR